MAQRSLRFNIKSTTERGLRDEICKVADAIHTLDDVEISAGWCIYSDGSEYLTQLYINKTNKTTWDKVCNTINTVLGAQHYTYV